MSTGTGRALVARQDSSQDISLDSTPLPWHPSSHVIPTGFAGVIYSQKLKFDKNLQQKHADYLAYTKWLLECETAKQNWEAECEKGRAQIGAHNLVRERKYKRNLIRELSNRGVLPTVMAACWKSGAKTTLLAYVGSIIAEESRTGPVLLPATANTSTGASGTITGLAGSPLTMIRYEGLLPVLTSARELAIVLPNTPHGLSAVVEDSDTAIDADLFTADRYRPILLNAYQNTNGCILEDTGNDDIKQNTIPIIAARAADVIVFVASNTQPHSHIKMEQTMNMLRKDPYTGPTDEHDEVLPGEHRSTSEKVSNALVVINGVKPDDEPYDFEKLRMRSEHRLEEDGAAEWTGEGYIIPWDPYVFGGHNLQNVVDLSKISQATYDAYLDVALAILREGARALDISLDDVPKFEPLVFEEPPLPDIPEPNYSSTRSVDVTSA